MRSVLYHSWMIVAPLLLHCSSPGETSPAPVVNGTILNPVLQKDQKCPNGTLLTYENWGEAFLLSNCTHCHARDVKGESRHGAPESANFDRPEDIAIWGAAILKVAAAGGNGSMPPSAQTSAAERSRLAEWLNCGGAADHDSVTSIHD